MGDRREDGRRRLICRYRSCSLVQLTSDLIKNSCCQAPPTEQWAVYHGPPSAFPVTERPTADGERPADSVWRTETRELESGLITQLRTILLPAETRRNIGLLRVYQLRNLVSLTAVT